jgi:hypothetical protein
MLVKVFMTSLVLAAVGTILGSDRRTPWWGYFLNYARVGLALLILAALFLIWN